MEEAAEAALAGYDGDGVEEAAHAGGGAFSVVDSVDSLTLYFRKEGKGEREVYNVVLILSNGVTASNDSVTPAPNPAMTVLGPEIFPSASCSMDLYWSKATNPVHPTHLA